MSEVSGLLADLPAFDEMIQAQSEVIKKAALEEELEAAAEAARQTKLQCCVDAAYLIASADGSTSADELGHIATKMGELVAGALTDEQISDMVHIAASKVEVDGRDAVVANLPVFLEDPSERETAFLVAAAVSWTGGGIGAQEGLALQAISGAFGWEMSEMHKLLGKARG